jgi:hypothetical protein
MSTPLRRFVFIFSRRSLPCLDCGAHFTAATNGRRKFDSSLCARLMRAEVASQPSSPCNDRTAHDASSRVEGGNLAPHFAEKEGRKVFAELAQHLLRSISPLFLEKTS